MNQQKSFATHTTGTLYLVPTPIGNLGDMTVRSIDTLKAVAVIAAEDTRHTQQLLNQFDIQTKQVSFHEHNKETRIPELVARLAAVRMLRRFLMPGCHLFLIRGTNWLRQRWPKIFRLYRCQERVQVLRR